MAIRLILSPSFVIAIIDEVSATPLIAVIFIVKKVLVVVIYFSHILIEKLIRQQKDLITFKIHFMNNKEIQQASRVKSAKNLKSLNKSQNTYHHYQRQMRKE